MPPVPKDEAERNKKVLVQILKHQQNKECADCTAKGPTWCPTNWGVFVCIRCAGIHRKMGTHISTVKSCTLDSWYDREVEMVKPVGNRVGKVLYESGLNRPKPDEAEEARVVEDFIRNKYERRLWMRKGAENGVFGISKLLKENPDLFEQLSPENGSEAASTPSPLTPQVDGPASISYGAKPKTPTAPESKIPTPKTPVNKAPVLKLPPQNPNAPSLLEFDSGSQQSSVEALLSVQTTVPVQQANGLHHQQQQQQPTTPITTSPQDFDIAQKSSKDRILDAFNVPQMVQPMYGAPRPMMPPSPHHMHQPHMSPIPQRPMMPPQPMGMPPAYGAPRPMYPQTPQMYPPTMPHHPPMMQQGYPPMNQPPMRMGAVPMMNPSMPMGRGYAK